MHQSFDKSALFYDALYQSKDYSAEFNSVKEYFQRPHLRKIVEFGSGTGGFTQYFASELSTTEMHFQNQNDIEIYSIEPNLRMINIAKDKTYENQVLFYNCTAWEFVLQCPEIIRESQLVISLFHVFSYMSYDEVVRLLGNLGQLLASDSILCFDFWDADAVSSNPPVKTVRLNDIPIDEGGGKVRRISKPELLYASSNEIVYDINFSFEVTRNEMNSRFGERHRMHAFNARSITSLITDSFTLISDLDLVTGEKFEEKNYGRTLIFRRI